MKNRQTSAAYTITADQNLRGKKRKVLSLLSLSLSFSLFLVLFQNCSDFQTDSRKVSSGASATDIMQEVNSLSSSQAQSTNTGTVRSGGSGGWTGPAAHVTTIAGRPLIEICTTINVCKKGTPFFLNLVYDGNWAPLDYQLDLLSRYVNPSQTPGTIPIVVVHFNYTGYGDKAAFDQSVLGHLAKKLSSLSPKPYLFIRVALDVPTEVYNNFPLSKGMSESGDMLLLRDSTHPHSLTEPWIRFQEDEMEDFLKRADAMMPETIVGFKVGFMDGGEWFARPHEENGTKFYGDVSDYVVGGFCAWSNYPSPLRTDCRAATTAERNNFGIISTLLDPSDLHGLRAVSFNAYQSHLAVNAITRILKRAKDLSSKNMLTAAFYGYLYGLSWELPTSGHTALTELLGDPSIDFVDSPYSYGDARKLGEGMLPQGPANSPLLHGKLWFHEDDTRTVWASPGPLKKVNSLWESIVVLRRNLISATINGNGLYLLDLVNSGWFGNPADQVGSETLWTHIVNSLRVADRFRNIGPYAFKPEIAVFVDDQSENYVSALTPAGDSSFSFSNSLLPELAEKLMRIGTPIRHYLLSDLLLANFDAEGIKLAILPNAFHLTPVMRDAINAKLAHSHRTILFVYASGYLENSNAPSIAAMSELTGIQIEFGPVSGALTQTFSLTNGFSVTGGPAYSLNPSFSVSDPACEAVLGRYTLSSRPSVVRKIITRGPSVFKSVYAATPDLPIEILRRIGEEAGVHFFTDLGDIVEASGNMLLLHARTSGPKILRLPFSVSRLIEEFRAANDFEIGYPSGFELARNVSEVSLGTMGAQELHIYRWTAPSIGNFDGIANGIATGWATDVDSLASSVELHFYSGMPWPSGRFIGSARTSEQRPDVNEANKIEGRHGFTFQIPSDVSTGTPIYAYVIDPDGRDGNTMIGSRFK